MQVIQLSHVRDYEESSPEDCYFLLGKRNHDNRKRPQNVLATAKTFQGLGVVTGTANDNWLLQPMRRLMRKAKLARENKMPGLKYPRRQAFFPFPTLTTLPV